MDTQIEKSRIKANIKMSPVEQHSNRTSILPHIYDGEYFEVIMQDDNLLVVRCKVCGPDGPHLRTSTKSNGNILKHIQRRHAPMMNKIKLEKNIKTRMSRFETRRERTIKNEEEEVLMEQETIYMDDSEETSPSLNATIPIQTAQQQPPIDSGDKSIIPHYEVRNNLIDNEVSIGAQDSVRTTVRYHYTNQEDGYDDKIADEKSDLEDTTIEFINVNDGTFKSNQHTLNAVGNITTDAHSHEKELIDFRKELMQREYDEMRTLRLEKHKLEMEILRADLEHKRTEHEKRVAVLDQKLKQK